MPRTNEEYAATKRQLRRERKAAGLCIHCGDIRVKGMFCQRCYDSDAKRRHAKRDELRAEVIKVYGGKCACCGELEARFLTIDHINNDGYEHRKAIGMPRGGEKFYKWIKKNNFPSFLQLLCWNCNLGKLHNGGVCPHAGMV